MRFAACALFILSLLCNSVTAENNISSLRAAAGKTNVIIIYISLQWIDRQMTDFILCCSSCAVAREGELSCRKWDCECAFKKQRGCCCGATELQEAEDQIFVRMMDLWTSMSQLGDHVLEVIGNGH